ncbi:deoxyguanosinetriphosphate triphosphohydrolase [Brevibacterium ravenspurgense]|uniref:Deoxyguanosinetriphosphate triphosphohydrolase-like protein n=1 Tax=Brevibacterium ravenspurgense TaxID=479117 RepID=A0A2I1IFQ2_9MICO|nr:deoxyguanosinetriphosphate triphosphohydrolase [Brevibacterium ravenspurgense]PKY69944.1 deoxyguanosinetriphosphate triphosphohydrolase [Brevibacterium ravenspurgense]
MSLTGGVAEYDDHSRERWVVEPRKNPRRSAFQRDRGRLLHSSALRRLSAKTQVVSPGTDDFVRNRLTHSLEVGQVGRELARYLGCDPDIVETASLAHDLGHPPFGHNGETILDDFAKDIGGFEGNAQTLRILTRLEPKVFTDQGGPAGLNLTRATLDACIKYPWSRENAPTPDKAGAPVRKFGAYEDDSTVFEFIRDGRTGTQRCIEAQLMDLADDIAYSVHDVEDAVNSGHLVFEAYENDHAMAGLIDITRSWYLPGARDEDIIDALDRLRSTAYWPRERFDGSRRAQAAMKHLTSQLIGRFVGAAEAATREGYGWEPLGRYLGNLVVPQTTEHEIAVLKGLATVTVMVAEERMQTQRIQGRVLSALCEYFSEKPEAMDTMFWMDYRDSDSDDGKVRAVIDQVASLTDHSAWSAYHAMQEDTGSLL